MKQENNFFVISWGPWGLNRFRRPRKRFRSDSHLTEKDCRRRPDREGFATEIYKNKLIINVSYVAVKAA